MAEAEEATTTENPATPNSTMADTPAVTGERPSANHPETMSAPAAVETATAAISPENGEIETRAVAAETGTILTPTGVLSETRETVTIETITTVGMGAAKAAEMTMVTTTAETTMMAETEDKEGTAGAVVTEETTTRALGA